MAAREKHAILFKRADKAKCLFLSCVPTASGLVQASVSVSVPSTQRLPGKYEPLNEVGFINSLQ